MKRHRTLSMLALAVCGATLGLWQADRAAAVHAAAVPKATVEREPQTREPTDIAPRDSARHALAESVRNDTLALPTPQERELAALDGFAVRYGALAQRAGHGDAAAAKELWKGLAECRNAPRDAQKLREHLAEADATPEPFPGHTQDVRNTALAYYRACSGLTDSHHLAAPRWVARAAALGDTESRVALAEYPPVAGPDHVREYREYLDVAGAYLEQEIAAGNRDALYAMSRAHAGPERFGSDPTKEYAYLYAYSLALAPEDAAFTSRFIAGLEDRFSSRIVAAGREQGESIFRQCCGKP